VVISPPNVLRAPPGWPVRSRAYIAQFEIAAHHGKKKKILTYSLYYNMMMNFFTRTKQRVLVNRYFRESSMSCLNSKFEMISARYETPKTRQKFGQSCQIDLLVCHRTGHFVWSLRTHLLQHTDQISNISVQEYQRDNDSLRMDL